MMSLKLSAKNFGQYFDHSLLRPQATNEDFRAYCQEGIKYNVKMLAINPAATVFCKEQVQGTPVLVGAAVGFPLGKMTLEVKVFETTDAIAKGADEIDYVIDIGALKSGDMHHIEEEMKAIISVCREKNIVSKVIFENCYLTDDEKKALCEIANRVKPDFIKTSTGFGSGGATIPDLKLMRAYADPAIQIKASGGIRTLEDVEEMIRVGVMRIGTSNTVSIIDEYALRKYNLHRAL